MNGCQSLPAAADRAEAAAGDGGGAGSLARTAGKRRSSQGQQQQMVVEQPLVASASAGATHSAAYARYATAPRLVAAAATESSGSPPGPQQRQQQNWVGRGQRHQIKRTEWGDMGPAADIRVVLGEHEDERTRGLAVVEEQAPSSGVGAGELRDRSVYSELVHRSQQGKLTGGRRQQQQQRVLRDQVEGATAAGVAAAMVGGFPVMAGSCGGKRGRDDEGQGPWVRKQRRSGQGSAAAAPVGCREEYDGEMEGCGDGGLGGVSLMEGVEISEVGAAGWGERQKGCAGEQCASKERC